MSEYGYKVSKDEQKLLDNVFEYHSPNEDQTDRMKVIRQLAKDLAEYLLSHCPRSEELKMALSHLSEMAMNANASIVRNEPNTSGGAVDTKPWLPIDHIFGFMVYLTQYPEELRVGAMNESSTLITPFKKYCEFVGLGKITRHLHGYENIELDDISGNKEIGSEVIRKIMSGVVLDFVEKDCFKSQRYFYKEDLQNDDPVKMKKPVIKVTFEYIDEEDIESNISQRDLYREEPKGKK